LWLTIMEIDRLRGQLMTTQAPTVVTWDQNLLARLRE